MNIFTKSVSKLTKNPYIILLVTLSSIISLIIFLNEYFFCQPPSVVVLTTFLTISTIEIILVSRAFIVLDDNKRLKEVADYFRDINSIYHESQFQVLNNDDLSKEDKRTFEKSTLESVCQRIAKIYTRLIKRDCTATVKLLNRNNGQLFATTYVRSESDSERDKASPKDFEVKTNQNTAFDEALRPSTTGAITFFHSADLKKDQKRQKYNNQRPNYENYYQSTIVVPIRRIGIKDRSRRQDIGCLCIDTKSRNRLDDDHHVKMLAALADQMYSFMSLMRFDNQIITEEE